MKKNLKLTLGVLVGLVLTGCTTYPMAENVKMISFEDDVTEGKAVGPITGEDCKWKILGYDMGGEPTVEKAMSNARTQSGGGILDSVTGKKDTLNSNTLRYINNVSTSYDGFNAAIVAKTCLVVKGTGYR